MHYYYIMAAFSIWATILLGLYLASRFTSYKLNNEKDNATPEV